MTAPAVRAVLFDLDGTLLDTLPDLIAAANLTLQELGRPLRSDAEIRNFIGKGVPHLVYRFMTEGSQASEEEVEGALAVFRRYYAQENGVRTLPFPGVLEMLTALKADGYRLALVTNKATAFTHPLLAQQAVEGFFDSIVCGDTLTVRKPDPAPLLLACSQLGVAPSEAVMVGDSLNDAAAAHAVGMPVLLLKHGYSSAMPVEEIDCAALLSSLAEIPAWLAGRYQSRSA